MDYLREGGQLVSALDVVVIGWLISALVLMLVLDRIV